MKVNRNIIESKCDGCGQCVLACVDPVFSDNSEEK